MQPERPIRTKVIGIDSDRKFSRRPGKPFQLFDTVENPVGRKPATMALRGRETQVLRQFQRLGGNITGVAKLYSVKVNVIGAIINEFLPQDTEAA